MNTDRLIRMGMRMLMLLGTRYLAKGAKSDPRARQAQKTMKMANRIRRM